MPGFFSLTVSTASFIGSIVPISWLTSIILTRTVLLLTRSESFSRFTKPFSSTGTLSTLNPYFSRIFDEKSMLRGSICEITIFLPLFLFAKAVPIKAKLFDSVSPGAKFISSVEVAPI